MANRFYGWPDDHEGKPCEEMLDPPRSQVVKVALAMIDDGEVEIDQLFGPLH